MTSAESKAGAGAVAAAFIGRRQLSWAYLANARYPVASDARSCPPRVKAQPPMTSAPCHRPPASTRPARTAASPGGSGIALAMTSWMAHCRPTTPNRCPSAASSPAR